jgi:hypothetical protein
MSDDTQPPWAEAMEARLRQSLEETETRLRQESTTLRRDLLAHVDDRTAGIMGIMARLDRLQWGLAQQAQAGVVVQGTAEMTPRRNQNTRDDLHTLTDMVLALSQQVRRMEAELRQLRGGGQA